MWMFLWIFTVNLHRDRHCEVSQQHSQWTFLGTFIVNLPKNIHNKFTENFTATSQVLRNNVRRDSHSEGSQAWSQRKLHSDYHREFTETFTGMFIVNITAYSLWYSLRIRSEYAVKVFFDLGYCCFFHSSIDWKCNVSHSGHRTQQSGDGPMISCLLGARKTQGKLEWHTLGQRGADLRLTMCCLNPIRV